MTLYTTTFRSVGNPDLSQYAPLSDPQRATARTLAEISRKAREYIAFWDLGGGNWSPSPVYRDGERVGFISYNGTVWPKPPAEWTPTEKPIYEPREIAPNAATDRKCNSCGGCETLREGATRD